MESQRDFNETRERFVRMLICYDSLTDYYGVSYAADDEFERRVLDSITAEDL